MLFSKYCSHTLCCYSNFLLRHLLYICVCFIFIGSYFHLIYTWNYLWFFSGDLCTEEIFATPEAIWSSDDGSHIMFVSFNDTQVGTMVYPWFDSGAVMAVHSSSSTSFPETRTVRYPTPGSANPDVHLWIVNIGNTSTTIQKWSVTPPITLDGQ